MNTAVPGDTRVDENRQEKVDKYQDLAREIKRLWKVEATVISIVIGALGTIPRGLEAVSYTHLTLPTILRV